MEEITDEHVRAMDHIFSSVLRIFGVMEAGTDELKAIAEPSLDLKLVAETFLDPNDFGFGGAQLCSGTTKNPCRWHKEDVVCKYNSKMAEILCVWLDKFSPSASSNQILEVAFEKVSSFVKVVVAGGDSVSEEAGKLVYLFVCP